MRSDNSRKLACMALLALAAAVTVWVERSAWPLIFPGLGLAVILSGLASRFLLALTSLAAFTAAADLALEGIGYMRVGEAVDFAYHLAVVRNPIETEMVRGDCPSRRFKPVGGRDENGWLRFDARRGAGDAGGRTLTVVVIGDSLPKIEVARDLAGAMGDAGIAGTVIDTSVGGYDLRDESCVLDEVLGKVRPDLVIHTLCPNDFYDFTMRLDLSGRRRSYLMGADYDDLMARFDVIPLLLESGTWWVERHRDELVERFGDDVVFDYADPAGFFGAVSKTTGYEDGMRELRALAAKYRREEVPAVFVLYPFAYRAEKDPGDILFDRIYAALDEAGAARADVRRLFARFSSEALRRDDGHIPPDSRPLNFLHYNRHALDMSIYMVLAAAEKAYGTKWAEPVRRTLLARMDEAGAPEAMIAALDPTGAGRDPGGVRRPPGMPDLDCLEGRSLAGTYRVGRIEYVRKGARIEVETQAGGSSFHLLVGRDEGGDAFRHLAGGLNAVIESVEGVIWTMVEENAARALCDLIETSVPCRPCRGPGPPCGRAM